MAKAYVEIPLTKGMVALVDIEDAERVIAAGPWRALDVSGGNEHWYALSKSLTYMHRLILDTPNGKHTDHINGNRLDNRRANLRIATLEENGANRGLPVTNKSGFKGVSWDSRSKTWQVHLGNVVRPDGRKPRMKVGNYRDVTVAAHAYDEAARTHHGEFARLNLPNIGERGLDGELRTI